MHDPTVNSEVPIELQVTEKVFVEVTAVVSSVAADSLRNTKSQTPEVLSEISRVFSSIADFIKQSDITVQDSVRACM